MIENSPPDGSTPYLTFQYRSHISGQGKLKVKIYFHICVSQNVLQVTICLNSDKNILAYAGNASITVMLLNLTYTTGVRMGNTGNA